LGSTLLTVYGVWQREGEGERAVMHLIARKLVDHSPLLQGLVADAERSGAMAAPDEGPGPARAGLVTRSRNFR